MFHSPSYRFRQHLWLCIALAITVMGIAARLGMAEKPGPITPVIIEHLRVDLPPGEEPDLVATGLDQLNRQPLGAAIRKPQGRPAITPVVIGQANQPPDDVILDVPAQIISVPLETLFETPADPDQVIAKPPVPTGNQQPPIPKPNQAPPSPRFEPVVIGDWPGQTPPALIDVPPRIVSVPVETITKPESTTVVDPLPTFGGFTLPEQQPALVAPQSAEPPPVVVAPLPNQRNPETSPTDRTARAVRLPDERPEASAFGSTVPGPEVLPTEPTALAVGPQSSELTADPIPTAGGLTLPEEQPEAGSPQPVEMPPVVIAPPRNKPKPENVPTDPQALAAEAIPTADGIRLPEQQPAPESPQSNEPLPAVVAPPSNSPKPETMPTEPTALAAGLESGSAEQRTSPGTPKSTATDRTARAVPLPDERPEASAFGSPVTENSMAPTTPRCDWWQPMVTESLLEKSNWVAFDMETVLLDTLRNSPRIQIVSRQTSIAIENIVQQDAAFDSTILFDTGVGRLNDPVGNTLTTGGPPRLIDDTVDARAGIRRQTRRGTTIDIGQELGLKTSNSQFFDPTRQGDTRLALSLTQPLLDRAGQVYNERLVTQARIDSRVSWQEMRVEVEQRIAEVMTAYWQLYEMRCHLLQHIDLLRRAQRIEAILVGRQEFDVGQIELAKARQRVARRQDRVVQLEGEVLKQQTRLIGLVGGEALYDPSGSLELIPNEAPQVVPIDVDLRAAVQQGIENRPEIRAATQQLESAALTIRVTRAELVPELNAVVDAYLAGLNGDYDILQSFGDQFSRGGPGIAAALEYQMPRGRRAAKSRVRQAQHRFRQRSEELREVIQATQAQIDTAVTNVQVSLQQQQTKQMLLQTAITEEEILTRRWEMMAGDGTNVGTVLENLLDAQQRRTDAEREWTSARTQYLSSLVNLQRAMGTLLIRSGIAPRQQGATSAINFEHVSDGLFPSFESTPFDTSQTEGLPIETEYGNSPPNRGLPAPIVEPNSLKMNWTSTTEGLIDEQN